MEPVIDPRFSGQGFGLGNFVFMVNGHMINAAGVNVYSPAQVLHRHGGAFNMPAGIARAPGTGPLHNVLGRCVLPKGKVGGMAFAFSYFNSGSCPQVFRF